MSKKVLIFLILTLAVSSVAFGATCPAVTPLSAIGGFNDPSWIAIDDSGNLYITDTAVDAIKVYSQSGRLLKKLSYRMPLGVAVDKDGLYITSAHGTLTIYDTKLTVKKAVKTGIKYPLAVAVSADRIYVSDQYASAISVFSKEGGFLFSFKGDGSNFALVSLAIEPSTGDVYVVKKAPAGVFVFGKDGNLKKKFYSDVLQTGGVMLAPRGIMLDNAGRIYVSDALQLKTYVFDTAGSAVCSFEAKEKMCRPFGIAMGGNKVLYIIDKDCKRLYSVGIDDYVKMGVSPFSLSFKGQSCGPNPEGQAIAISNEGKGVLRWSISSDSGWIVPSQTSGEVNAGASSSVDIGVDTEGLSIGTYKGSITVSSTGAVEKVDVALEILPPPSLSVSPSALSFLVKGRDIPPAEGLNIELSGDTTGRAQWSASSDSGWLSVYPSNGPSNTLTMAKVSVNVAGLAGGVYNGNITVSAGCANGSPQVVPVSMTYIKGGTVKVSTNLAEATFTVAGPEIYSGSGTSYTVDGAPEGIYTITFGRVSGFKTPSSYSLSVVDGQTTEFVGNYKDLRKAMKIIATMAKAPESIPDELKIFERTGTPLGSFIIEPAGSKKSAALRFSSETASGDVDGDGIDDIIVARGKDGIINGYRTDGSLIDGLRFAAFMGYNAEVTAGDLNGDGIKEIIVGAAPFEGNPSEARVFSFVDAKVIDTGIDFLAYEGSSGLNVASGDIDGDGIAEIITTKGGRGRDTVEVRIWKADTEAGNGAWKAVSSGGFIVAESFGGGDIAAGDIDGDGTDEIIIATVPQPSGKTSNISVFRSDGTQVGELSIEYSSDIAISAGDTDFDGVAEIVVGDGSVQGSPSRVRVYDAQGRRLSEFTAFDNKGVSGVRISLGELGD